MAAWGLNGGEAGDTNVLVTNPDSPIERRYQKTSSLPLERDDVVSVQTGGGGGYGSSFDRDPMLVREDVIDGYVS